MPLRDEGAFERQLIGSSWTFSRDDGVIFARKLNFLRNGRVGTYSHPNEAQWRMRDGCLEFLKEDGTVTTRFDIIEQPTSGLIRLRGLVLPATSGHYHCLEASGPRWGQGRPTPSGTRVAVLIRTHVLNDKLIQLVEHLSGSPLFDLYVLADETAQKLDITCAKVISHSVDQCEALGLNVRPSNHPKTLWLCGDYAIYCAYDAIPNYDYYIMIEFDVYLTRENPLFIEGLINRLTAEEGGGYDFVGTAMIQATIDRGMGQDGARRYGNAYYSGIFSLVILSNRAVRYLFDERLAEGLDPSGGGRLIHCEIFVATALMKTERFRCVDIASLIPGSLEKATYHEGSDRLTVPNFFLMGTRPDHLNQSIEIIHPVIDADDYINRHFLYYKSKGDLTNFITLLNDLSQKALPESILEIYRERVAKLIDRT